MEKQAEMPSQVSGGSKLKEIKEQVAGLTGVGELFKILSDDTRNKLLYALHHKKELCVRDMAELTNLSLPAVSHHLRIMRNQRLVNARRVGKEVYYSLRDRQIVALIAMAAVRARALGLNVF
ncbi:MAG: ArsR/SmtB family transcription factor [bacterium]